LFKYLHRQIHFNDYIKSIVEVFDSELIKGNQKIDLINTQQLNLLDRINVQQSNITMFPKTLLN
jgi:hypothetical protein